MSRSLCARCLGVLIVLLQGLAPVASLAAADFAARLSSAAAAMEYWDVTAWLESGHRFTARFLITNQGPGMRTAAAVGHLILPGGEVVPITYGRTSEAWTLTDNGRRLKIASAVLDLSRSTFRVEVDSDRRGIKFALEFDGAGARVSLNPLPQKYSIDVLMPERAQGSVLLRGMADPVALSGLIALTHTSMNENEAELVTRRTELFGRAGDAEIYLSDVALAGSDQHATLVLRRGDDLQRSDAPTVGFGETPPQVTDPGYPVARHWEAADAQVRVLAQLRHEYLRWDPLEILPQPFRFILSLDAAPRRVWSEADIEMTDLTLGGSAAPRAVKGSGIAVVTFARALPEGFP